MTTNDEELGLSRPITRRDFVHDVGLAGLGLALPWPALAGATAGGAAYYPPTLTGLRGAHPGSFEVAHALAREGRHSTTPSCSTRLTTSSWSAAVSAARGRVLSPQAPRPAVADPDPRQSRRLRRPRQAQRISPGRTDAPRLGRHREHRVPEVQPGGARPPPRPRHRHPAPAQGFRLQLAWLARRTRSRRFSSTRRDTGAT